MIWFFYNILFVIAFTLLLPRFFLRMWRRGGYRRHFMQRLAWYDRDTRRKLDRDGRRIWVHAVSVGEMYVALRFMAALRKRFPDVSFVLSTITSTGHAIARQKMEEQDVLLYFPVDIPPVMSRVLRRIQPRMLVMVDTELWPNLIRLCRRRGIPVAMINGRVSQRSFRRYKLVRLFTRRLLPELNIMCMQSESDRERLLALGAPPEQVEVVGSAKYEVIERDEAGEQRARDALRRAGIDEDAPVLLGGSTWPGEEEILLDGFRELRKEWPRLFLVLVPRHMERSREVSEAIERRGFTSIRRSTLTVGPPADAPVADVLLVDTTGELKDFYAAATVIFVGKSLTAHGGQNVIEPGIYQKPIIVGPNMENFPAIMEDFQRADALKQVGDSRELHETIGALLRDAELRRALGERAGRLVQEKAGALNLTLDRLSPLLEE